MPAAGGLASASSYGRHVQSKSWIAAALLLVGAVALCITAILEYVFGAEPIDKEAGPWREGASDLRLRFALGLDSLAVN